MEDHAQPYSDYEFIQWEAPAPVVVPPVSPSALRDFDTTRITLVTDRELRYWTGELRVTIYEILDAIEATGTRCASDVRNYLVARREGAALKSGPERLTGAGASA